MIHNSIGSRMFQAGYAEINGKKTEVTKGGDLSCAFFVSGVLSIFNLIDNIHATVANTIKQMEMAGWKKTKKLTPGCVLVWQKQKDENGEEHAHIGFFVGNEQAISNSSKQRVPIKHQYTFGEVDDMPTRKIVSIFQHPKIICNE